MKTYTLGDFPFTASDGVSFGALKLDGWDGAAGTNLALQQKPRGQGSWRANTPQRASKVLVLSGLIRTDTTARMLDTIDALNDAADLEDTKLTVDIDGTARWSMVALQDVPAITLYPTSLVKGFSLQLVAEDPRKMADPLTASTGLPSSSGGLTVPFTVPFTIDSTVVTGQCSLTNPGNESGPVTLRIEPLPGQTVTGPKVTHVGTGRALVFAASLTIASGDWLDVDMENETVLANGQAPRNGYVTDRGWSSFESGGNTWAFSAVSGSGLLTVTATPSWK